MKSPENEQTNSGAPTGRNPIAEKIKGIYRNLQIRWAEWMWQKTSQLTKSNWIAALIILTLLVGGYSSYLIVSGLTGAHTNVLRVASIRAPVNVGQTGEPQKVLGIGDAQYSRILRFRHYMDSLARDAAGRKVYDSILKKRPGLMDSLRQVEEIYKQSKIK